MNALTPTPAEHLASASITRLNADPFSYDPATDGAPDNIVPFIPPQWPSLRIARRHVAALTGSPDTAMHARLIHDLHRNDPAWPGINLHGPLDALWPEITARQREGYGAFLVVNDGGTKDVEITRVRAIFADLDNLPLPAAWHVAPSFLTTRDETHWHPYWLVGDLPPDAFTGAQKRLAARYGSDGKVCNPSRVMRLAGTLHLKDPAHPRMMALHDHPDAPLPIRTAAVLLAGLPEVAAPEHAKVAAPAGTVLDTPSAIARATSLLRAMVARGDVAIEGCGGNNRTYQVAAELHDQGCSQDATVRLLLAEWNEHCRPPWDAGDLATIVGNASRYGQNEPGAWAVGTAADSFGKAPVVQDAIRESAAAKVGPGGADKEPDDEPAEVDESWAERVRRFRGVRPSDGINLPPIRFLDPAEKTLPLTHDGAVLLWYGPRSAVKTANAMCRFMRAIKAHLDDPDGTPAVRVAYCVGEGVHGFLRQRVPAIADHFGLSLAVLDRYWRTVPVPTLDNGGDVKAFCAALADLFDGLPPTVLVVDTFATAAGAVDENGAEMGKLLLSSGPVGRIKRKLGGPLVVVISHAGKDEARGARGHSSQEGNVDGIERHQFNKETRVQLCHIEKMRDAEDGFTVEYHVSPAGSVPIVTLIGRVDGKGADTATKGGDRVAEHDRQVLASLRWMASWRKDRTTTKDLYLAVCRMDDTWLADPDHHGPDAVLAGKMTDAEAAGWNAARQRLNDLARDRKGRLGSAKIATKGHSDRGWTWWPYEAPGADLDD